MRAMRNRMLGSAAFACFVLAGSAAMAQQDDPTQHSTPPEKQQTQQLNEQGVNGTYTSPAQLNGQAPQAYGNATPAMSEGSPPPAVQQPEYGPPPQDQAPPQSDGPQSYNAPRTGARQVALLQQEGPPPDQSAPDDQQNGDQYGNSSPPDEGAPDQDQQEQQSAGPPPDESSPAGGDNAQIQYQQQMDQYQRQQDQYQAQRAQYAHDMRRYDLAEWRFADYPRPYPYRYDSHLWRIYLIEDPTHQLAQAPIEGPSGEWVGKVRNVETNAGGGPWRIEVALNRRVSVWVQPDHFRFDPSDHIVYTDLTRDELWNYPGARVESGYWP